MISHSWSLQRLPSSLFLTVLLSLPLCASARRAALSNSSLWQPETSYRLSVRGASISLNPILFNYMITDISNYALYQYVMLHPLLPQFANAHYQRRGQRSARHALIVCCRHQSAGSTEHATHTTANANVLQAGEVLTASLRVSGHCVSERNCPLT